MAAQWGTIPRQRLMENITLQCVLKEIIEDKRDNVLRGEDQSWRQLSIEREKTIADLFAFLSATHDDNSKVMAVCLEESRDHNHLTIRIASNTGNPIHVRNGLDEMAKILVTARGQENAIEDDYMTLLRCIVRVDWSKILCRLRSRHAARTKKANRRSPLIQLREALDDPSIASRRGISMKDLLELRTKAQYVESLSRRFESEVIVAEQSEEAVEMILDIIRAVERFESSSMNMLRLALASSHILNPSTERYLPEAIGKIARYSSACRYLVNTVRRTKYSIFNSINVEVSQISLPDQPLFRGPFSTMEQACQNAATEQTSVRKRTIKSSMMSYLGATYYAKANDFRDRVSSDSSHWKVHAEIQLLVYHALNPEKPQPRVIASSKSACYLCNLFINLHGQFQTPRTHGRIYDRWVLPDWVALPEQQRSRMGATMKQLNTSVERTIIATVRAQRKTQNHPNESILFHVDPCSTSTINPIRYPTPLLTPPASISGSSSLTIEAEVRRSPNTPFRSSVSTQAAQLMNDSGDGQTAVAANIGDDASIKLHVPGLVEQESEPLATSAVVSERSASIARSALKQPSPPISTSSIPEKNLTVPEMPGGGSIIAASVLAARLTSSSPTPQTQSLPLVSDVPPAAPKGSTYTSSPAASAKLAAGGNSPDTVDRSSSTSPEIPEEAQPSSPPTVSSGTTPGTASSSSITPSQPSIYTSIGPKELPRNISVNNRSITTLTSTNYSSSTITSSNSNNKSYLKPIPQSLLASDHTLSNPGQTYSFPLSSPTHEAYVKVGKLHLALTRETLTQQPTNHTVNLKLLEPQTHSSTLGPKQKEEVINAKALRPGEDITVESGAWHSEGPLVINCGKGRVVSLRYCHVGKGEDG